MSSLDSLLTCSCNLSMGMGTVLHLKGKDCYREYTFSYCFELNLLKYCHIMENVAIFISSALRCC